MPDDRKLHDLSETSPLSAGDLQKLRAVRLALTEEQQATLLIYFRDGVRVVHLGEGESVVVGRTRPADVPIRDNSLSRQHACVELTGGEVWIEDLQSTNGTLVNGEKIERCKVEPGAEITFGAVPASVHSRGKTGGSEHEAESHEGFLRSLELEVRRAHDHQRTLALLLFRAGKRSHPATGPAPISLADGEVNLKTELNRLEGEMILSALKATDWDRKAAAASLGLPLSTMAHKMKAHSIRRVAYQQDED